MINTVGQPVPVQVRAGPEEPNAPQGYLTTPAGDGPWPAVVLLHEMWGVDAEMLAHSQRLARRGYLVLTLDLFRGGGTRCLVSLMRALVDGRPGRTTAQIEDGLRWLRDRDDCTGRVGVIGFCLGGSFALLTAASGFDAASVNYAHLPGELDTALRGACPVLASYGSSDRTITDSTPGRLRAALDHADVEHEVDVYDGAGHAFLNSITNGPRWLRPLAAAIGIGPHQPSAATAWATIDGFLDQHLTDRSD